MDGDDLDRKDRVGRSRIAHAEPAARERDPVDDPHSSEAERLRARACRYRHYAALYAADVGPTLVALAAGLEQRAAALDRRDAAARAV